MNEVLRSLMIIGATVAGVAAVTLALIGLIVPRSSGALPSASADPTFDLAVPPDEVGGSLAVDGDRTGTLMLDRAGGASNELFQGDTWLIGQDGRIRFSRDAAEGISQIQYDGLSFYLDPGDCTITLGEINATIGLMSALVECPAIADVRDVGVISIEGVVALPANVFGDRGDLPPTGGSVDVGDATLEFGGTSPFDLSWTYRPPTITAALFADDEESFLVLDYDPTTGVYLLTAFQVEGDFAGLPEPCPVAAEELGRLSPTTTVIRLTIDCEGVELPGGGIGRVEGSVVADIVEDAGEFPP